MARDEASHFEEDEPGPVLSRAAFLAPSLGVPALHPDRDDTHEPPDFVEPGAVAQLGALGRDIVDELASLALLRVPGDDDPWTIGAGFEARLLVTLDAACALGRGPIRVDMALAARARAEAAPIAEPCRWFVATFLLACTAGERAMDALREALLDAPSGMRAGLVDALCLGSNPARLAIITSLFDEDDRPELLCIALEASLRLGRPGDALTSTLSGARPAFG